MLIVKPPSSRADKTPVFDPFAGRSRLARQRRGVWGERLDRAWWLRRAWTVARRVPPPWRMALAMLALLLLSNLALDTLGAPLAVESDAWGALAQIARCERQSQTPDIVVLGSSRAQAGIAPPILDGEVSARLGQRIVTCDMAVTTSVPMQDYLMLRKLLADGVRPRFIVYATADYEFNSPVAETNVPVRDNLEYLSTLGDLPALARSRVADPSAGPWNGGSWYVDFAATRLVRAYGDRLGIEIALCRLAPAFGPCPSLIPTPATAVRSTAAPGNTYPIDEAQGWYPLPEATDRSLLNSRAQYTAWLSHYQVSPDALDYLGKLVTLARDHHIGIVLVNTPILPRHLAFFPRVTDYLTYLDALYRFAAAHGVPFYDEGLGLMDDQADFADTNHLDYWGALAFTGWLGAHVVAPEFARQVLGQQSG